MDENKSLYIPYIFVWKDPLNIEADALSWIDSLHHFTPPKRPILHTSFHTGPRTSIKYVTTLQVF